MRAFVSVLALIAATSCCRAQETPALSGLIQTYAQRNDVPKALVERVISRESRFNPRLHGRFWGLMQILPSTARALGYRGRPAGLLDPETNLTYGVLYLANAWRISGGDERRAMRLYSSGYYYEAKRRGRLGLIKTAYEAPTAPAAPAATAREAPAAPPPPPPIAALLSLVGRK